MLVSTCFSVFFLSEEYARNGGLADGSDSKSYETAIVRRVQQRSFEVIVPKYGIEKMVWVEDLVDRDLVGGCEYNETKNSLKIEWKESEGEEAVSQEIQVFDQIPVRIEIDMKKSPPEIKIIAVLPGADNPCAEYFGDKPMMNADLHCLAILDNNN